MVDPPTQGPWNPVNLVDLEGQARGRVEKSAFDYIAGGSEDEATLAANLGDFGRFRFMPRFMRDVSHASLETSILGHKVSMPVAVAPTAFHRLVHPEGEVATAQATADAGTLFTLSSLSNRRLEDVAAASTGPKWMQVYVFKDRSLTEAMVERAKRAGYTGLALTVDVPVAARRERDHRNRLSWPADFQMGNFEGLPLDRSDMPVGRSGLFEFVATQFDPTLTWDDVAWLRDVGGLPVIVKGVLSPEDARLAVDAGADAVWVSNHGGRQLDHSVSAFGALPGVVDAVGDKCEVYLDGGVRRGTDVLKALCLGARAVFLGRPVMWGLALGGREGAAAVLRQLENETRISLQLLGERTLAGLGPHLLREA